MNDPRRILVRAPNWIGDQILARNFFETLRTRHPNAEIVSACVPWVSSLQYRDCVDGVVEVASGRGTIGKTRENYAAGGKLRAKHFDLGIALPNSFSSALFLWSAGCAVRRGYGAELRDVLLTDVRAWSEGSKLHRSAAYCLLAGEVSREPIPFEPARAWPGSIALDPPTEPYFVLAPGSAAVSRRWPVERFAAVAEAVWKRFSLRPVIVGGKAELSVATELERLSTIPWINWVDRGSPAALWKLFRSSAFSITNESGLAHLSSLCGAKTFIVVGAADPSRTVPVGPGPCKIVTSAPSCWPCERNTCRNSGLDYLKCLNLISVAEVTRLIEQSLES